MTKKIKFLAITFALLFSNMLHAGFEEGDQAYKKGDYVTALREFIPLAEKGDRVAQFLVGNIYKEGHGVPKDINIALAWFLKSANQGHSMGQMFAADILLKQENYVAASPWEKKLAEQGFPNCMYTLGKMYELGRGVPKDVETGVRWIKASAEKGFVTAQGNLGVMYYMGMNVAKDEKLGIEWISKAAEQGEASSQTMLGMMYNNGEGVEKDMGKAVYWLQKAVDGGNKTAQEFLDSIRTVSEKTTTRWTPYKSGDFGTLYVDFNSTHKTGNKVKVWELIDFKHAKDNALSAKLLTQFDCEEQQYVGLGLMKYAKNMGDGKEIYNQYWPDSKDWKPIMPDTNEMRIWNDVCSKK